MSLFKKSKPANTQFSLEKSLTKIRDNQKLLVSMTEELELYEKALESQNQFINSLLQTVPDAVYLYDLHDEKFLWVNNGMEKITGYRADELISFGPELLKSLMCESSAYSEDNHRSGHAYFLMSDEDVLSVEYNIFHKNGNRLWIRCKERVYERNDEGSPVKILGVFSDITKHKRDEEKIKIQLAALNNAANSIMITDKEGIIIFVNQAFVSMSGYSIEDVIGKSPRILKSGQHDDTFYQNMWNTLTSGKVWSDVIINKKKDGSLYQEVTTITPVFNGKINYFVAIKECL